MNPHTLSRECWRGSMLKGTTFFLWNMAVYGFSLEWTKSEHSTSSARLGDESTAGHSGRSVVSYQNFGCQHGVLENLFII